MNLSVVTPAPITEDSPYYSSLDSMTVPWLESPFFERLLEKADLSDEDKALIRRYAEDGYVVIDPRFPEGLIDRVISELEGRWPRDANGRESRIQDGWQISPSVRELATYPQVLQTLEMLYQRTPIPFQTLNFKYGTEQLTHSDTIHFQSIPANFMCGVWVAMEDVDEHNGPLHYYPRSHRLPSYDMNHLGLDTTGENYPKYEQFVQALFATGRFEKHIVNMKKGEALIWSANLYHGGNPILDPGRTRLSQVTHYFFEKTMYYTPMFSKPFLGQTHFRLSELQDIRSGEPLIHYYNGQEVDAAALVKAPATVEEAPAPSVSRRAQIRRIAKKVLPPVTAALLVSNAVLWSKWKSAADKNGLPE